MAFYVAVHGETGKGPDSQQTRLTPRGIEYANELADKFKRCGLIFSTVYTAPEEPAREAARSIAKHLQLPPPIDEAALAQRGEGESDKAMINRMRPFVEGLPDENVILVVGVTEENDVDVQCMLDAAWYGYGKERPRASELLFPASPVDDNWVWVLHHADDRY